MNKVEFNKKNNFIYIFLILIAVSLLATIPLYKKISSGIKSSIENAFLQIEQNTGLKINYDSISPSILKGIKISSISVSDAESSKQIFEISSCLLEYDLVNLFRGKFDEIITNLVIDGVNFNFDKETDFHIFEKITNLVSKKSQNQQVAEKKFNFSDLDINLPFDVSVRNIKLNYSQGEDKISILLKKIFFDFRNFDNSLSVSIDGGVFANINQKEYSGKFSTTGNLRDNLDGSALIFRLSNFSDGNFTIGRVNLLLEYNNSEFLFKTVQNNYPLFLSVKFNTQNEKLSLSVKTKNLTASSVIVSAKNQDLLKKLKNAFLSIELNADYAFETKKLSYSSGGNFKYFFENENFLFDYGFYGNEEKITVSNLKTESSFLDLDFFGDFIFKNLNLSGNLSLKKLKLNNGGVISTEIFFDPLEKGFMAFAPEVSLGEKIFTALQVNVRPQNDSVDLDLEVSDYSNEDSSSPALVSLSGSYIPKENYFQSSLNVSNLFLDSVSQTTYFFTEGDSKKSVKALKNYVFNGEFFASSDFSSLSFNIPYAYLANVKNDNEFLYASLDGNNNSIQVSRFDYIKNGKISSLLAQIDKNPDSDDFFVNLNLTLNSIPYNFTGSFMPGVLSLKGDYGTSFELYKTQKQSYNGTFILENFPVTLGSSVFSLSLDSSLKFSKKDGFNLQLSDFSFSETTSNINFKPKFNLKGAVTNDGVLFNEITYSDTFSTLFGRAVGTWNFNDGIFENLNFDFNMSDSSNLESVMFSAQVSNPDLKEISSQNFYDSLFINSQVVFNNFGLSRFTVEQSENNSLSASLVFTGTLKDPYIGLNVSKAQFLFTGNFVNMNFTTFIEDKKLSVSDFYLKYNNIEIKDFTAALDFNNFSGNAKSSIFVDMQNKSVSIPLEFSIFDAKIPEDEFLPESFQMKVESKNISGTIFKNPFSFEVRALYEKEKISFSTSDFIGLYGEFFTKTQIVTINTKPNSAVSFIGEGNFASKDIFLTMKNINVNLGKVCQNLNIKEFELFKGFVKGDILITGLKSDPYFSGKLLAEEWDFALPTLSQNHIFLQKGDINIDHNEFILEKTSGKTKKNDEIFLDAKIIFDRWFLDRIEANVSTEQNYFPMDLIVRVARFTGLAKFDLDLLYQDGYLDISGDVYVKKVNAKVLTGNLLKTPVVKNVFARTDINIFFGSHVSFQFDPILRCVFAPDSNFKFKFNEEDNSFVVDGTVELRTGDISYLNRNFYLKSGFLKFSENDVDFNPIISVKAETRERDENGKDVTIIMSVENQPLLSFTPIFSSVPAKSEKEIRTLLGEIVKGDSENVTNLLISTSDYAIQSLLGRSIENRLRDFFNFDILSIRTLVLQNALKSSFSTDRSKNKFEDFTIGNLLDNSTVYIGKYIGSDLYLDALLRWSYDESKRDDFITPGGLVFKPELGLEIETPFANIKWKMAPEFTNIFEKKLVSSTSVTLTWKFTF